MKVLNVEAIEKAIKNQKWDKHSFAYAIGHMSLNRGDLTWKKKAELVEEFYRLIQTKFKAIESFTTFKGIECFVEEEVIVFDETVTFVSPINLETTYRNTQISEKAKSTIQVVKSAGGNGWFEWFVPELDMCSGGQLLFEGKKLVEYDGVFDLPDEMISFLEKNGYDCEEVKTEEQKEL